MGRILAVWGMGVVCMGLLALPTAAEEEMPFFSADGNHEAHQRISEALQKPLPDDGLEFNGTPLEEIVAYLRDEYKIEIQIDRQPLEELGVDVSHPISVSLRNISLRSALNLMLKQLEMTYVISNEVLLLTTQEEADQRLIVCVYPVRDLIDPLYQPTKAEKSEVTPPELLPIIDTIISTITYDDAGCGADIRGLRPGLLVISQTQAVHEQIRNTLAAIRRAKQYAEQNQPALKEPSKAEEGGFGGRRFGGESGGQTPSREKPKADDDPFSDPRP